jgi:hypothetical protein
MRVMKGAKSFGITSFAPDPPSSARALTPKSRHRLKSICIHDKSSYHRAAIIINMI